jgi:hypothetical protein
MFAVFFLAALIVAHVAYVTFTGFPKCIKRVQGKTLRVSGSSSASTSHR